jgi:predicted metal-dependent enzyme (double-stranded beta helix superfamily)
VTLLNDVAALSQTYPGPSQTHPRQVPSGHARLSQARLRQLVSAVAAQPENWAELVRFGAGQRWYRRLELADDYELWLLSWLPGQGTGFHDHGLAAGAFAVAQGQVRERTAAAGSGPARQPVVAAGPGVLRQRTVAAGGIRSFGPQYVHDVANAFAEPAVTVHAYSPPLTAMRRYQLTESGLVHTATERAEQDW